MIQREQFLELEKEFGRKEITALVGARQVGKSTILKELFSKVKGEAIFINFDRVEILNLFENNIESFITQYIKPYKYIFIDEIQYSKKSGKYLKYIYDDFNKKIFVSGSSVPDLSIKTFSYLVGRIRIFEIFGISFREFISYKSSEKLPILEEISKQSAFIQFRNLLEEYLTYGSYPAVIIEQNNEEKRRVLKDIVNTYLLKEIREILQFENTYEFELLLKRLSLGDGNLVNYSNISSDISIKSTKLKEMISILEKTYILKNLNPYLDNKIKELIRSPKTYYLDLGFRNNLTNNFSEFDFRQDKGETYENFIFKVFSSFDMNVQFWNYKNEYEMDFVYEKNSEIFGFECKSKLHSPKITPSMKRFIQINKPKKVYVFNETLDSEVEFEKTKILFTNYLNIFTICEKLVN
jgi:predicted AAA+ superfamily ATPase